MSDMLYFDLVGVFDNSNSLIGTDDINVLTPSSPLKYEFWRGVENVNEHYLPDFNTDKMSFFSQNYILRTSTKLKVFKNDQIIAMGWYPNASSAKYLNVKADFSSIYPTYLLPGYNYLVEPVKLTASNSNYSAIVKLIEVTKALFVLDDSEYITRQDYTSNILMSSYNVNSKPIYKEWTDANGTNHRYITRNQIGGSFTMWFDDPDELFTFMKRLKEKTTTAGYATIGVYVNNLDEFVTIDAYVDYELQNDLPYFGAGQHDGFTVTISER
jgi:hypothetical protein